MPSPIHSGALALAFRPPADVRPRIDRRSHQARDLLLTRVRGEFTEMPCLSLTLPQAMRLFGLREDICRRLLGSLVADGALSKRDDDRYISR
jgi:hypothetical protein